MEGDQICPRCGQLIPKGQTQCPYCAKPKAWWTVERETLLIGSIAGVFVLFAITGVAANLYHAKQRALAQEWFAQGEQDLKASRADAALEDFRTALAYSPESELYRLRLAQALIAAHRTDEARSHLLTLWRDEPGNGTVNLELARLAAGQNDMADALRYFHNAIFGVWEHNPEERRRQVRLELCEFLLKQGATAQAQSELIALAAVLPQDAASHTQVAGLFRSAGDYHRALEEYRHALEIDRHDSAALVGAGEVAFQMADYRTAASYLERAVRAGAADEHDKELLETSHLIQNLDPMNARLSRAEADQRTLRAFETATARLDDCLKTLGLNPQPAQPQNDLQRLSLRAAQLRPEARTAALKRNPDLRVDLMDFVTSVEEVTAKQCGTPTGPDLALLLIARMHGAAEQ
jgi:tetratricopeptide (TPR) repeat protein